MAQRAGGAAGQRDIEILMPLSVDPPVDTETEWLAPASDTKIDP